MHARRALTADPTDLLVVPWDDPVIDEVGHDPLGGVDPGAGILDGPSGRVIGHVAHP